MILDTVLMASIFGGLHYIKSKYPDFLFFAKGAVLFVPPEDTQQTKPKKKKEKIDQEVTIIKIDYESVKEYPFASQFSRVQMTTVGLMLFFVVRMLLNIILPDQSLMPFYTCILMLIYSVKLGIETFFLTNYNKKNCFLIAFGINALFYLSFICFEKTEGVYDNTIKTVIQDYKKHLQIIFNRQIEFFTYKSIVLAVLVINFFIIISVIPAIIKFGNWYAKTLKEVYYEQQESVQIQKSKTRKSEVEETDIKERQKQLKQQSKKTINKLNIYLVCMLVLQFFSHRFVNNYFDENIVYIIRAICIVICIYIICLTMNKAIEFNGSFAYKFVMEFFQTEDSEKRAQLRKRIAPYIYYIWYHYFQFVIRIIVPILVFLTLINWKYLHFEKSVVEGNISDRVFNPDIECSLNTDTMAILQNLYKCSSVSQQTSLEQKFFLNGIIESIPKQLQSKAIQDNIESYGFLTRQVMVEFWQQLFWYSSLSIYLMTVAYILFLRKTVYEL